MNDLYTKTSIECSALVTRRYSTSFSLGIRMLGKEIRNDIFSIYGFVRLADEIVDTYQDHDPVNELRKLKEETFRAIENRISFNPIIHAFQNTVHSCQIDLAFIEAFLYSMELDLCDQVYDRALYEKYIYGSAEVVGLMCLKVFCKNNPQQYDQLEDAARKLGSAFQKVNFLRDIKSDLEDRKRVYFPGLDVRNFTPADKKAIEKEIEEEFRLAQLGINQLNANSRSGVQLALNYYRGLLRKISKAEPSDLLKNRIRISNVQKLILLAKNLLLPTLSTYRHA